MLDFVESRFNAIGLKAELDDVRVIRSPDAPDFACMQDGVLVLADKTFPKDEMLVHIVRAIGFNQQERFTPETAGKWSQALIPASLTRVKTIQQHLRSAVSFEAALGEMDMPVTRLLAIHLFNALISAGTSFANAQSVDFEKWGSTQDLVFGKSMFSLLPLLGAYAPRLTATCFPIALTELVCNNLSCVTHSDVRAEFSNLIVECFNAELKPDEVAAEADISDKPSS
jgi:hypothetical protein